MPDIFDEVQEDLRAERAKALGRRFAGLGIACAVLILAGTGGYVAWQQNHDARADAAAARFITAARLADKAAGSLGAPDAATTTPAATAFADIAASGPAGYRVLARLRLAALQWQTGQHAQAIAAWQTTTDDVSAPPLLRDLATLISAEHQVDTGDAVLIKQRLQSLTGPANPWAPMAEQVIALLDIRTGRQREAAAIMQQLTMRADVPQDMRQMAADILTTLSPEALTPAPKPPAPAAPASAAHG